MSETDPLLIQLIVSFQSAAMLQMGKIMNPVTGKIERDLDQAKQTIDMLSMLESKTAGNLSDDERQFLEHVLYELRMNFVDEKDRPAPTEKAAASPEEKTGEADGDRETSDSDSTADERVDSPVEDESESKES
jgi:hypothetical protein